MGVDSDDADGVGEFFIEAHRQRTSGISHIVFPCMEDHIKRSGKVVNTDFEDLERASDDEEALERTYIREEEKIIVHRALSNINPDYGRVLYLKFFEDLSNEEIAAVLKRNKRQVENLLYQSKRALRSELEKEGFHYEGL